MIYLNYMNMYLLIAMRYDILIQHPRNYVKAKILNVDIFRNYSQKGWCLDG